MSLTIKELIAKKEQIKDRENRTATLFIKSLNGTITIKRPSKEMCLDSLEMEKGTNEYLVYQCVVQPNLKDSELQKAFNCVEPIDIVDMIFEPGEVTTISTEIVKLAGYEDGVKVVDEIKN